MQSTRFPLLDSYVHRLRTGMDLSWRAGVELLLIGVVIYAVLRFLEGTRGARLMKAVLAILTGILVLALVARLLQLDRILVLYPYFVGGAFLIALVVFQPELRRGLTRIGESLGRQSRVAQSSRLIEPLVQAATNLSKRKIGALVAIERRVPMGGVLETGVTIDASISHELLETIFWPGSALHDLGVVISRGRVAAAGCEFPLAEADPAHRIIGSRHRAALGMSLETDALVVVVSEETGTISVAIRGKMHRELNGDQLREMLAAGLLGSRHSAGEKDDALEEGPQEESATESEEPGLPVEADHPLRSISKLTAAESLAESKAGG
jgi:diadenylate cyclase